MMINEITDMTLPEQKFWYLMVLIGFVLDRRREEALLLDGTFLENGYGLVDYDRFGAAWYDLDHAESVGMR